MFISKLSPEQWAEARRLRAAGESCTAIARRFGVTRSTVAGRARREAWPGPDGAYPAAPRAKARPASPATADIHAEVARRLFGVIAVRTRMMELSMQKRLEARKKNDAGSELPLATMEERDDFAALIQDIKQVLEISPEPAATAAGRTRTTNPELAAVGDDVDPHGLAVASEKDALRAELAERLGKMFPQS
jgi:hypothetical protein